MQKVRISTFKTFKIILDDESFVEVKDLMDYGTYKVFVEKFKKTIPIIPKEDCPECKDLPEGEVAKGHDHKPKPIDTEDLNAGIEFLKAIIVSWNFINQDGLPIDYKPELVEHMGIDTLGEVLTKAVEHYSPVKKN